jgi:hypothetical protein
LRSFFRRGHPPFTKLLLIESGSRPVLETLVASLRQTYGPNLQLGLVTCFAGVPKGFEGDLYRIAAYQGSAARTRLYAELNAAGYTIAAILCTGEPIMTKWKWAIGAHLDSKILVVNENGDYFWLDRTNWRILAHFVLFRAGMTGGEAIPTIGRLLMLPLSAAFLILYAATVHARRRLRLLF